MRVKCTAIAGIASLQVAAALCVARPGAAASLQEVTGFGNNPSNEKMYLYVPDKLAQNPPLLVAIHYCGGSAMAYFTGTGYRGLADQYGFIVIYPQTTSSDGCFDVHSDATLKHEGGSDSLGIVSMVRYTLMKYAGDASRVYVTGTSSGAMMTNVLLGAYPDVFRAGAAFAGVPYGCFAGQSAWNSACAQGMVTKTGQQWGDLVRAAYPGYTGSRPRVQLWHGDMDETLYFHNFGEAIKEWTNVLGVSETPTTTEQNAPQSNWTRTRYKDSGGTVRVEGVVETGATHNLTVVASEAVRFFGLDGKPDPGGPSGGAGGSSGMGGASAANGGAGPSGGGTGPSGGGPGRGGASADGGANAGVAGGSGGFISGAAGGPTQSGPGGATSGAGATASGAGGSTPTGAPGITGGAPSGASGAANPANAEEASSSCSVRATNPRSDKSTISVVVLFGLLLRRMRRAPRGDHRRSRRARPIGRHPS